jgi:hypothetical protein
VETTPKKEDLKRHPGGPIISKNGAFFKSTKTETTNYRKNSSQVSIPESLPQKFLQFYSSVLCAVQ